ncbi:hypothetical protein [Chitinophaga sp.]|uniref:hypothetical protein n=1 Tax=Chitinophaga sp. TaxID=1869181 RepID=UPI0031D847E9
MNQKLYLVLAYHVILFLESMVLVTAIEGYNSPLFHTVLYFNLLYLPIGGILNYAAWCLLQSFLKHNKVLLQGLHIIAVLLLLNIIVYFTEHDWLFHDKWTALLAHVLVADCYILAILLTRKKMQQ